MEAIIKLSSSTGKSHANRMEPVRMIQTEVKQKKEKHRFEPIRIKYLCGQSEKLESTQKDSVRKRFEPVRLPVSSNRKSVQAGRKTNGITTHIRSTCPDRSVRRNLNFNGYLKNGEKDSNANKPQTFGKDETVLREVPMRSNRGSLLLPPNFIKNSHLKKLNGKPNRHSKIPESCETAAIIDKTSNTEICSAVEKNKSDTKNVLPSETCILKKESNSIVNDPGRKSEYITTPNKTVIVEDLECLHTCESDNINENNIENIKVTTNDVSHSFTNDKQLSKTPVKSLCNDFQSLELTEFAYSENIRCNSTDTITINRKEVLRLISNLKDSISTTENNLAVLKSTYAYYTRILNMENIEKETDKPKRKLDSPDDEPTVENKVTFDKEIQAETCSKSAELPKTNQIMPPHNTPKIVIECVNTSKLSENIENDKENQQTLNEVEPITRATDAKTDSFLEFEDQLLIAHEKDVSRNQYVRQDTPVNKNFKGSKVRASMKEYLTLKSTMSFFQTPDTDRFKSFHGEHNITNQCDYNKMYISKKAFSDLNNLYSESPEYS